jgi:hypothetical protein
MTPFITTEILYNKVKITLLLKITYGIIARNPRSSYFIAVVGKANYKSHVSFQKVLTSCFPLLST